MLACQSGLGIVILLEFLVPKHQMMSELQKGAAEWQRPCGQALMCHVCHLSFGCQDGRKSDLTTLHMCSALQKKARQIGGAAAAAEPARQEAPSTPVPSDARLASLGEALIRQKESQEQATQVCQSVNNTLLSHLG